MFGSYVTKKVISIVGVVCLCSGVLLPRIDMLYYKGTWDVVNEKSKDLSPFRSIIAVESGLAEKMHTFGKITTKKETSHRGLETEYVVAGDATIKLSWCLFKTEGGQFAQRAGSTHIAAYLKPKYIGQLLQSIEKNSKKTEQDATKLEASLKSIMWRAVINSSTSFITIEEWLKKIRGMITQDLPAITDWFRKFYGGSIDPFGLMIDTTAPETLSRLTDLLLWGQKEMVRQQKLAKVESTLKEFDRKEANIYDFAHFAASVPPQFRLKIKKAHEYWSLIQKEIASKNFQNQFEVTKRNFSRKKRAFLAADINTCAILIVQALTECGYFQEENKQPKQLYDSNTVHQILLALLYLTIEKPSDLKTYFDQFNPSILAKEYEVQKFNFTKMKEDAQKFFADSSDANKTKQKQFIENNFEDTCVLGLLNKGLGLPPQVKSSNFSMGESVFGPCGEVALFNWTRILLSVLGLYDPVAGVFNLNNLEKKLEQRIEQKNFKMSLGVCKIKDFFKNNIPSNDVYIMQGDVFKRWVEFASNHEDMKYLRRYTAKEREMVEKVEQLKPLMRVSATNFYEGFGKSQYIPCSEDDYLVEVAGCPSNYVNFINHVFGLQLKSFQELCHFFDLEPEQKDEISDGALYSGKLGALNKGFLLKLQCSVNEKKYRFYVDICIGHTEVCALKDSESCGDSYGLANTIKDLIKQSTKVGTSDLYLALSCYQQMCSYQKKSDFGQVDILGCNKLFYLKDLLSRDLDELQKSIMFAVNSGCVEMVGFERLVSRMIEYCKDCLQRGGVECLKDVIVETIIQILEGYTEIQPSILAGLHQLGTFLTFYSKEASEWLHIVTIKMLELLNEHHASDFAHCEKEYKQLLSWIVGSLRDGLGVEGFDTIIYKNFLGEEKTLFTHASLIKMFLDMVQKTASSGGSNLKSIDICNLCLTLLCLPEAIINRDKKIYYVKELFAWIDTWGSPLYDIFKKVVDENISELIPVVWQKLNKMFMQDTVSFSGISSFSYLIVDSGVDWVKNKEETLQLLLDDEIVAFEKRYQSDSLYFIVPNPIKKKIGMLKKMAVRGLTWGLIGNDNEHKLGKKTETNIAMSCKLAESVKKKPFVMSSVEILNLVAKDIKEYFTAGIKSLDLKVKINLCIKWKKLHGFHEYKLNEFAKRIAPGLSSVKREKWVKDLVMYLTDTVEKTTKQVMRAKSSFLPQWFLNWWYKK